MPIEVAIVEDNTDIREGLRVLINGSEGFACRGTYDSGEAALAALPALQPDVVLMDIELPGMSGIEAIKALRAAGSRASVMMLTVFDDDEKVFQSLLAGATGYLVKKTPPAQLLESIETLHRGGSPMSNQIARKVVETFQQRSRTGSAAAGAGGGGEEFEQLSGREQEILQLLAQGHRYKDVADALCISLDTVRTHIRHIYEKLHVHSRTEALLKAFPR